MSLALIDVEAGRGDAEKLEQLGRELHTIKGEARMFGLPVISELVHATETLVVRSDGRAPEPAVCAQVIAAVDLLSRFLRDELGSREEGSAALAETQRQLEQLQTAPDSAPAAEAPPPDEVEPAPAATAGPTAAAERWTQVAARQVDQLCQQVAQFSVDFRALTARFRTGPKVLSDRDRRALEEDLDRCRMQFEGISGSSWALQLQPIEPSLGELVRHARELAVGQGKRLRGVVSAAGAQVERSILDELWEPLLHVVRNSVDHGVERPEARGRKPAEATLTLRAEPSGSTVLISVTDDGRGVDPSAIRATAVSRGLLSQQAAAALSEPQALDLLFQHGFSTRTEVSELSGRGVGLDVVRSVAEKLGGSVTLTSTPGEGTEIVLSIPTRLSQEKVLVIECGEMLCGIPARQVAEVVRRRQGVVERVSGAEVFRYRDSALPFHSLSALLGQPVAEEPWLLIVAAGARRSALAVPALVGEHELLRQPLDRALAANDYLGGSSTLDDGRLVMLLALGGLLRRVGGSRAPVVGTVTPAAGRHYVLVVEDSEVIRDLVADILRAAGIEVRTADDGQQALAALEQRLPDAILCDIDMPVMDGLELLRHVRQRWPDLPMIMLTTRGSEEDRRQAATLGANAHLVKSGFREDLLLDTLRRFLDVGT